MVKKRFRDVTMYQCNNVTNSYNNYSLIKDSLINSSIDGNKKLQSYIVTSSTANGRFDLADAQALIGTLTGWARIPGNPDQATHALGAVIDIHEKHKDATLEYLRPYWVTFKERYPRSTHIFWLTDWAVQGTIPAAKGEQKRSGGPTIEELYPTFSAGGEND
jgi:hypothetical protein